MIYCNLPDELKIHIYEYMVPRISNTTLHQIRVKAALGLYDRINVAHDYKHIFNTLLSCNCCERHQRNKPYYIGCRDNYPISLIDKEIYFEMLNVCNCSCRHICRRICEIYCN